MLQFHLRLAKAKGRHLLVLVDLDGHHHLAGAPSLWSREADEALHVATGALLHRCDLPAQGGGKAVQEHATEGARDRHFERLVGRFPSLCLKGKERVNFNVFFLQLAHSCLSFIC